MCKLWLVLGLFWVTAAGAQTTGLSSTPASGMFYRPYPCTGTPIYASFAITSSAGSLPISASVHYLASPGLTTADNPPESYALSLDRSTTPAILSVNGTPGPGQAPPGTFQAIITVSSPGQPDLTIPLAMQVNAFPPLSVPFLGPFSVVQGASGNLLSQTQTIYAVACTGTHDFNVTVSPPGAWLHATASTLRSDTLFGPADLTVTVNPTGLSPGTYNGTVGVDYVSGIPISLTVYGSQLTATPAALTFNQPTPAAPSTVQTVQVTTSGPAVPFTVTVNQGTNGAQCGETWLTATPGSGSTTGTPGGTPLTVSYNAAGLVTGTYVCNGTVTVASSDSTVAAASIPVRLNVGGQPTITAPAVAPSFTITSGYPVTADWVPVAISSSPSVPFQATASVVSPAGGNWLMVQSSGSTNGTVQIGIRPGASALPEGTYLGNVTVSSNGSLGSPITIPVVLTVNDPPTLTVNPAAVSLVYYIGYPVTSTQTVNVTTTNGTSLVTPATFTVAQLNQQSGHPFATPANLLKILTPAGATTGTSVGVPVSISFDPAVASLLPLGTYGGTIRLQLVGAANINPLSADIPWTLLVSSIPPVTISSTVLSFTSPFGSTSAPGQTISISSNIDQAIGYAVTYSSTGNWLTATPSSGITPGSVTVTVNPSPGGTALAPGNYQGSIRLTAAPPTSPATQTISVVMTVRPPVVTASPSSIGITQAPGLSSTTNVMLTSSVPLGFTVSAVSSVPDWLSVSPASGTTGSNVAVTINTNTLTSGTYTGTIRFTLAGNNGTVIVPVTVTTLSPPPCSVTGTPNPLALGAGGTAPNGLYPSNSQLVTVTPTSGCPSGVVWTATSSNSWIRIGTTTATTLSFSALSNTQAISRTGTITLATIAVPPTLASAITITEAASTESTTTRQVRALYQSILGREPDVSGFAFWSGVGQPGLGQMGNSFLTSPENLATGVQTLAMYRALLARMPNAAEFQANALHTGGAMTASQLFDQLLNSAEYATKNGPPSDVTALITTLFQNLLGRAPTSTELSFYVGTQGHPPTFTPYESFADVFGGNEFRNLGAGNRTTDHSNDLYVTLLYLEILGRAPDAGGYAFWLAIANSGGPGVLFQPGISAVRDVIMGPGVPGTGFIGSAEFQGRF